MVANDLKLNIIVTHRLFAGSGQELYKYFKNKNISSLLVEHSFMSYPDRKTTFCCFNGREELLKNSLDYRFFPDLLCYIKDFFYSLTVVLRYPYKFYVYIGCGGFNVLPGLVFKLFGRVKKVIFYTIDFSPKRFDNLLLNKLYFLIDKICVNHADYTWNLSNRMAKGRKKYNNMPLKVFSKQRVVPIGVWLNNLPASRRDIKSEKKLVFCGDLIESQGLELVLESIPAIVKRVKDFKFIIIGDGNYRDALIRLVKSFKLEKYVEFKGAIYKHEDLLETIATARAGIAPYKDLDGENSNVYFADVTKPKTYLSCGLPIIITKLPDISQVVRERKMGITINYDKNELVDAVVNIMNDDNLYLVCKRNAEEFIQTLDWNNVFNKALEELENV